MIKNLLLLFAFQLGTQCNSQKIEKTMKQNTPFENIEHLEGNWYNTKKNMENKGVVTNLALDCTGKSFWEISNTNGKYSLLKHFATGKNCVIHVIKTTGLNYKNGRLQYIEDDMSTSETVEKLSDKKFKITEQSFVDGETILIDNFYEKK